MRVRSYCWNTHTWGWVLMPAENEATMIYFQGPEGFQCF
jgi:hypothetical protein